MQTFLPYRDFEKSAACLDRMRLGKQRVECLQILKALNGEPSRWRYHPAVKMWNGYVEALVEYGVAICDEWLHRGYRDTCRAKIIAQSWGNEVVMPNWLSNRFIRAHRSNLLRKDAGWYQQFNWDVPDNLPYIWPI
jgi:hypothetical protein